MGMRKAPLAALVIVLALATPATAAAPPQVVKLRKQVAALKIQVKRVTAQKNAALRRVAALNAQVAALKAQLTPKPTGSVKLENGENGDHAKVTGAGVNADGDVLGQIEYVGGLTCTDLGPYLSVDVTFFDAAGQVLETGNATITEVVAGVRYPLKIVGADGAVRADGVVSITCF